MMSFGYRFNPRYAIKECSSYGTFYTRDCGCSKGNVKDKILVPKPSKNCARCTRCGYLVDGPNCQGCALLRQELEENLVTYSPDFQNISKPSNASTNVINAPREPYVDKQDNGSFVDKIIFRAPDSPDQFHCFHCKDVLRYGEACKRCTCVKCGSGIGKGLCYICGHNQNSLNDSPSISETSLQSPSSINHCCYECGDPLDGIFCKQCTCKFCGKDAHIEAESSFTLDSTPTYVDESPNVFNPPLQSPMYPYEFCGNDAYYAHYCTPPAPFIYPEPCYNKDFNFLTLAKIKDQMTSITSLCKMACQVVQKKLEEKQIEEERAAKAKNWKLSVCYDDDDDEEISNSLDDNIILGLPSFSAITPNEPVLSTEEPDNSLSMGDEHLDTIPVTESNEFIKSGVENLIPIPNQFENFSESNEEFYLTDDDSFSIDNIDYIEASPPDSELVSSKVMEIVIQK
uniref:Uncharacterized protein n=2 Tax=Tanacetum cinerariifolium TaxID=118510 RepID=A0A699LCS2_TANCI|nr:hypothetical protein [Tanacetum cinerariifolium]